MSDTTFTVEPGTQQIVMERTFAAPAEKVFNAFTDADTLVKWWGGGSYDTEVDVYDARSGGSWRVVQSDAEGGEYAFHGVFHEVAPNQRIIWTFEFEGLPEKGHALMETMYFSESNGQTTVKTVSVFQSVEDRDGMVASGMESGARKGFEVLAELLEK